MQREKWVNWGLFVLLSVIWGSSFIVMKISKEALNGWQIGSVRIFSAGLVFLPFAFFHIKNIPLKKLPIVFISGLIGNFFPALLFAISIEKIDSSLQGILNSLTPFFVVVIGVLFFKQLLAKRKIIGVLIGFTGLVLLSLSSGFGKSDIAYAAMVLFATMLYGLNVNVVNSYLKGVDPISMATVSITLVSIPAFFIVWKEEVFSMIQYDSEARLAVGAAALLGIVGSAIATALFYMLIKRAGGLFASLVTYAIPVVAIAWGLLAGEQVSALQFGCLAIILYGVYFANK